jgi:ABC-type transport system substrate-binding protein
VPASGGTLVFGGGQDTQSFNIILFPKSMCTCNSLIYSTLFKLNATGTDVEGDLVERWDIQPDGLVYVLHLRPDAVWHDGQPVTADDVVFTMQALRDPKTGSTYVAFLDGIDQFTVDGPQTVRLTLRQPVPALLSRLSRVGVLPKHLLVDEPNAASSTFNQHPVGSGPFKFESYTPGVQITLVRNDQYYLGPPRWTESSIGFRRTSTLPHSSSKPARSSWRSSPQPTFRRSPMRSNATQAGVRAVPGTHDRAAADALHRLRQGPARGEQAPARHQRACGRLRRERFCR